MTLSESGFEAGKRNFLQLTDKDGEQPQMVSVSDSLKKSILVESFHSSKQPECAAITSSVLSLGPQDESGTADSSGLDDSSQERFIGPLPKEGAGGCSSDYSSPSYSYSYSSILNKSDTGETESPQLIHRRAGLYG